MRFEERELKDYAEPVIPVQLRRGGVHFSVQFVDEDLLVPVVQPLVFLGKDLTGAAQEHVFFQDFESYCQGLRYDSAAENDRHLFQIAATSNIKHIFEYERALDVLMSCALRRRKSNIRD
jgi:hypothetical protein